MEQRVLAQLQRQGVEVIAPQTLTIDEDVQLERIRGPNTVLHPGTTLRGADLLIGPGCSIGHETPATVDGCALGRQVRLGGGSFVDSVFLDSATMGSGAQVRAGCLLEEQAGGAHTVGLKQTILLPFVTLGSLINFCDILMAGGRSRRDHSEVGSSFIHFNFTPFGERGDKATPSLIGDVPRGVMLRSPRIFLGGQGGLVGPLQIGYGTVLAAGFVYRRDHGDGMLVVGERLQPFERPFQPRAYGRIRARVAKNLNYIGNLTALHHWYQNVRLPWATGHAELEPLYRAAQRMIERNIAERVKQLARLASYMPDSIAELQRRQPRPERELSDQRAFHERWPETEQRLLNFRAPAPDAGPADRLAEHLSPPSASSFVEAVQRLDVAITAEATAWLEQIVDRSACLW